MFKEFETTVVNELGEELLISRVRSNFKQYQQDVHLLSSAIAHVKY